MTVPASCPSRCSSCRFSDGVVALSKEAVEWISQLNELAVQLEDFEGEGRSDCHNALESAAAAFARLDHERDLVQAVQTWRRIRMEEEAEQT